MSLWLQSNEYCTCGFNRRKHPLSLRSFSFLLSHHPFLLLCPVPSQNTTPFHSLVEFKPAFVLPSHMNICSPFFSHLCIYNYFSFIKLPGVHVYVCVFIELSPYTALPKYFQPSLISLSPVSPPSLLFPTFIPIRSPRSRMLSSLPRHGHHLN